MRAKSDLINQPYYKCLSCPELKERRCYYPRTAELDLLSWCSFIRESKIIFGMSNDSIAHDAEVSEKTIERIVALNCDQDIMRDTCRRIEKAVFGAIAVTPCCHMHKEEKRALEQELQSTKSALEAANKELATLREDNAYLKAENKLKSKVIWIGVNRLNDLLSHD